MTLEKNNLNIGYIPLLDCVAILWAERQGYFSDQGLSVNLLRESSWASLRDRLNYGFLDAAHCLSAMLPAAALSNESNYARLQTPLILSVNQAFISLRQDLCLQYGIHANQTETQNAQQLVQAIQQGQAIHLAYVYKHSIHHYCLKEWLALADESIAHNTTMLTSPPPFMVKGLSEHIFDGFCVGEPWNIQAELEGHGYIVGRSQNIIPAVADKVLAVTEDWAESHPQSLAALTQAIRHAQNELKNLEDLSPVWQMLREYDIIRFDCSPHKHVQAYEKISNIMRSFVKPNTAPQAADFHWIVAQMQKWEGIDISEQEIEHLVQACIYQSKMSLLL